MANPARSTGRRSRPWRRNRAPAPRHQNRNDRAYPINCVSGHTGAITGSDAAAECFFRHHGIHRVDLFETLFELPDLLLSSRKACNDNGALLIFDEIPTGLGKTGAMFTCDHDGVEPDILVMGKALAGGILPLAAVLAHPKLDVAGTYAFGHHTHEKNPVSARAGLTTIEIIEDENLVQNAAMLGAWAVERLNDIKARHQVIGDIRGRGFLIGIELVNNRQDKQPANDLAEDVLYRCLDNGLSFKTTMGNTLTLTPPLITTRQQMDLALGIIEDAIRASSRNMRLQSDSDT